MTVNFHGPVGMRSDLAVLAAQNADSGGENKSYIVTTNWTAIVISALLVVVILVAVVLAARHLRSRGSR